MAIVDVSGITSAFTDRSQDAVKSMASDCAALARQASEAGSAIDAVIAAARKGYQQCVDHLLQQGYPVEGRTGGDHPLHEAARKGHISVMASLLARGASLSLIDGDGRTPLGAAVYARQREAADYLVQEGADKGVLRDTDTRWVSLGTKGHSLGDLVRAVGDGRRNPNALVEDGYTPLHLAARRGVLSAIDTLISHGAEPDGKDVNGRRPLHWAALAGNVEALAELIFRFNATVDAKGLYGRTALSLAAGRGDTESAWWLLEGGADVNARSNSGRTPLHYAVTGQNVPMVELLLSRKAIASVPNDSGYTPRMIALIDRLGRSLAALPVDPWDEEVLQQKILSHVWSVNSKIYRDGNYGAPLTGFYSRVIMPEFVDALVAFRKANPVVGIDSKHVEFLVAEAVGGQSSAELMQRYRERQAVLIGSGYDRHAASVLLLGDRIFVCNRGGLSRRPIEAYRIDPNKVTTAVIDAILEADRSSAYFYLKLTDELPGQLSPLGDGSALQDARSEQMEALGARLGHQTIGNCTWAHLEAVLLAYLGTRLDDPDRAWAVFEQWLDFTRGQRLSRYVESHLDGSRCLDPHPNVPLLEKILQQSASSISNMTVAFSHSLDLIQSRIRVLTGCVSGG